MACAPPFKNPRSNALAYLKTKGAIDENRNIRKGFQVYADRLQRSALSYNVSAPLFIVNGEKVDLNEEAFAQIDRFRGEIPVLEEINVDFEEIGIRSEYREEELRSVQAEQNKDSVVDLPSWLDAQDQLVLNKLVEKGHVELNCL